MEIFGIGPLEFLLIILLALIIFGPEDLAKAGRTLGRTLRKIVMSEEWRIISQASKELSRLPNRLMREAGVEDLPNEIKKSVDLQGIQEEIKGIQKEVTEIGTGIQGDLTQWQKDISAWTTTPPASEKPGPVVIGEPVSEKPLPATLPSPPAETSTGDILPLETPSKPQETAKPEQEPDSLTAPEGPPSTQEAADLQTSISGSEPVENITPLPVVEPPTPDITPATDNTSTDEASSTPAQKGTR